MFGKSELQSTIKKMRHDAKSVVVVLELLEHQLENLERLDESGKPLIVLVGESIEAKGRELMLWGMALRTRGTAVVMDPNDDAGVISDRI